MAFIAAAGLALSAGTATAGLIKSGKANKQSRLAVAGQNNLLDEQYLPDLNKRYTDTEEAKSFLSTLRDRMTTTNQQVQQTAAVTGGTDESVIAGQEAAAGNYGDYLNKLSAQGTQYKQGLKDRYMQGKSQMLGVQLGQNAAASESGSNLFANSMSTMGNIAMGGMMGGGGDARPGNLAPMTGSASPTFQVPLSNKLMMPLIKS